MSYSQYLLLAKKAWIQKRDQKRTPKKSPLSILNLALLSVVLTVAHAGLLRRLLLISRVLFFYIAGSEPVVS